MKKNEKTRKAFYPERDEVGNWWIVEVEVPESAKRRMMGRPMHQLVILENAGRVFWEVMNEHGN